ncbi:hypothetical protein Y032_0286g1381 [Ancylostoma ceylanicum]|uniref:Uncharacterized protein n=2 Tax=Ancylostoma ceylanicum TaxID=53326 RepID=A0A016S6S0_9BILA|nr:hypothetical protein Y032_0286g1381 [Ancylostoma ceylanicum]
MCISLESACRVDAESAITSTMKMRWSSAFKGSSHGNFHFCAIASASLLDGSMETGTALQPNNFSSIARRLLLNREPLQVPQLPSTSYEVHRPVTHVDEVCAV